MEDHMAYAPSSPCPHASFPANAFSSNYGGHHLGIGNRTTSFSEDSELPIGRDWPQSRLGRIIEHPQFESFCPWINTYLQLNDHTFTSIHRVREDPEAKTQLEPFHSSFWRNPPEEIWVDIVHLRGESAFSSIRTWVVAQVHNAYCQSHRLLLKPQPHISTCRSNKWDMGSSRSAKHSFSHARSSSREHQQHLEQLVRPIRQEACQQNHLSKALLKPALRRSSQTTQRLLAKSAPKGMSYHCPSQFCTRKFTKQAHYTTHLSRKHPEYVQLHPGYLLEMALGRSDSVSSTNDRPAFNSTTSLSAFDDNMSESAIGVAGAVPDFVMPDDNGTMYIGGGMSMTDSLDTTDAYYMGTDEE